MHSSEDLSPRDLALALGVSESTVRRWVDREAVRSRRTDGGHRRISLPDALEFVRTRGVAVDRPELLGLQDLPRATDAPLERFHEALVAGRQADAEGVLLAEFLAGRALAELCDDVVTPSMARIGELWRRDADVGMLVEHRATGVCIGALHRLRTKLPDRGRGRAVGGACPGDPYLLPSLMAALVLQVEGFTVTDFGANTPFSVLRQAASDQEADVVWISVSTVADPQALGGDLATALGELASAKRPVVVGGRALPALHLSPRRHVHRGTSMRELAALGMGVLRGRAGAA